MTAMPEEPRLLFAALFSSACARLEDDRCCSSRPVEKAVTFRYCASLSARRQGRCQLSTMERPGRQEARCPGLL